jgi:hypothetical protein
MTVLKWVVLYKYGESRREASEGGYNTGIKSNSCQLTKTNWIGKLIVPSLINWSS